VRCVRNKAGVLTSDGWYSVEPYKFYVLRTFEKKLIEFVLVFTIVVFNIYYCKA